MMSFDAPYIPADQIVPELTVRGIILATLLTVILAMSNAYLALKLGFLTSASIPAAMISIGVLRFFKGSSILENNAVQTAASAGEAVAGGIVYTIPGLIIIHYWYSFDYLTNFLIALCGGVLGVLFSIPLRRVLVNDHALSFPEGRAIAAVLKSSVEKSSLRDLLYGGFIGGLIEWCQLGFKWIANAWTGWVVMDKTLFGFGAGFSATMIGAGFLLGHDMAISIFLGAIIAWVIALPIASRIFPQFLHQYSPSDAAFHLWNTELRYLGIGAMLFAGLWTFAKLFKPLTKSIRHSLGTYLFKHPHIKTPLLRTDKDIGLPYLLMGVCLTLAILFLLFQFLFPLDELGFPESYTPTLIFLAIIYVVVFGFLFSVITAYFSGMVGVSASPGSAVVIAGVLLAAWFLLELTHQFVAFPLTEAQIKAAEAITIMVGSVVTGIAAIANDNSQDLKVGQLVGATPWKQQLMLLFGVLVSALVIPWVMQLMFSVYGIAGVMPHEGMNASQSLPAPTAALLAAVSEAVFRGNLPWGMMLSGGGLIALIIGLNRLFNLQRFIKLSMLGIAIGMYLPLSSTFPLFIGGAIALMVKRKLNQNHLNHEQRTKRLQTGVLIACGLVAGSTLIDVVLAFIFSIMNGPDSLTLVGPSWANSGVIMGVISTVALAYWIKHRVSQ